MFLSKLLLNIRDRQARRDVASPYDLHRTLWRAFTDMAPGRILFRVDADRPAAPPVVLVQSDLRPHWENLSEFKAAYLLTAPECKEYQPSFARGQRLRFRLRANPTKKVATLSRSERLAGSAEEDGATKNGQRLALLREADQIAWLLYKGEAGGFRIPGAWCEQPGAAPQPNFRVEVMAEGWVPCGKYGHTAGRFYTVRFEGRLEVTDPHTVADGLGTAKGFGFGLLSLAAARS